MLMNHHGFSHMAVHYQEESASTVVYKTEVVDVAKKMVEESNSELQWELGSRLWQQLVGVLGKAKDMQVMVSH